MVPASYTPPFLISVVPADVVSPDPESTKALKTILTRPTKGTGPNPSVPVTPLTTLLVKSDLDYYKTNIKDAQFVQLVETRLNARKKQVADALDPLISKILGPEKAKTFDLLTDSSFVPGSNDGSDLLLDNISVDIQSFKVSLKNGSGSGSSVSFDPKSDPATKVQPITVAQTDVVLPTTRLLKDFAGVYDIDVTFTSYHATGSISTNTQTQKVTLSLYNDGTFDTTYNTTHWSGKYTINSKGTSVKISGNVGDGNGNLVGSIDNNFNMKMAYHTTGSGNSPDTTTGSVVSTNFAPNPDLQNPVSNFAGTYTIQVNWYLLSDNTIHGSDTGNVIISSNGSVTQCTGFQILVSCAGSLTFNSSTKGAGLKMSATSTVEGVTGTASITGDVTSSYSLTNGYVLAKDAKNNNIADGDVTGSRK